MKENEIKIKVSVDENHVPEKIEWQADDNGKADECNALMMSIWDAKEKNVLRIDLWNKEHTIEEMKMMVHQTILTLADTFERATDEKKMASEMRDFGHYFAHEMSLVK